MTAEEIFLALSEIPELDSLGFGSLRAVARRLAREMAVCVVYNTPPMEGTTDTPPIPDEEWGPRAARDAAADARWERIERAAVAILAALMSSPATGERLEALAIQMADNLVDHIDRLRAEEEEHGEAS